MTYSISPTSAAVDEGVGSITFAIPMPLAFSSSAQQGAAGNSSTNIALGAATVAPAALLRHRVED